MILKIKTTIPSLLGILFYLLSCGTALAQPSNDNCFGAVGLTPNATCIPVTGTVANATQSLPGCTGTADDDVWYSFVANQTSLSVQVTGSANFNPVIQVYSGVCGSLSSLNCINNTGNGGTETAAMTTLIVGITYWVRVYHLGATYPTTPTFSICVSPQAVMPPCAVSTPAGNTCGQAALICDVNGYCGSTSASYTADYWPELGSAFCGSIENNSFIQFVANSSTVSLNVWVTSSTANNGIQIMVFSATNCSGPVTTHLCVSPLAPSPAAQAVTVTGLTPGNTYYMMIDGYAGDVCNYVIGVNSGIQVSGQITTPTTNVCLGNSVTLTASGGNGIYTWNPSPDLSATTGSVVIATPTTQGAHVYSMTTNSSNPFCPSVSVSNITINAFAPPTPNAGVDDSVCLGNQIFLSGTQTSTANSMSWQYLTTGITPTPTVSFAPNFTSLTPTVSVNQPGLYQFILRETNSVCGINRDTVRILVMNPQQTLSSIVPSCFGMSDAEIHVDNTDATQYSFDNGTTWQVDSVLTGLQSGIYTVCSRNYLGCSVCSDITINNPTPIDLTVSNDTIICENGTATLTANAIGGISFLYHWNFTSNTGNTQLVNPIYDSLFTVYAENENGCLSELDSIFVSLRSAIAASISSNSFICPGYPTDINASASGGSAGPFSFIWSNGINDLGLTSSQSVDPDSTTTYTVTISDGCESTPVVLTTEVAVLSLPVPLINTDDQSICEPAIFTIESLTDASMVEHLFWNISDGQTFVDQESITTDLLPSGVYSVQLIVTSPQGCIDSTTFTNFLTVYAQPHADFNYSPNPVKMFNTDVQLTNYSSNGIEYQWYIQDGEPSYSEQEHVKTTFPDGVSGEYEVTLITTSEFGCSDTATKIILVIPEILLYAPNTFTPDGDEFNQQWSVFIEGIDIFNFNLKIFNRWGQLIWESHDPTDYWDGTYNGELVQSGIYTWTIEAKDKMNDAKYNFNGHINVLR